MNFKTKELVIMALFAGIFCVLGPIALPIGPVPISLTNFVLYISVYVIGGKKTTTSYLIYLLLGGVGLPVFSGYGSGLGKLLGVTGGYLIGFIFTSIVTGIIIYKFYNNKIISIAGMFLGLLICYAFGTAWFAFLNGDKTIFEIIKLCVIPFIALDCVKILISAFIGPVLKTKIHSAIN